MALKAFKANDNDVIDDGSDKINKTFVNLSNLSKNNKSRNLMHMLNIGVIRKFIFLILMLKRFLSI